MHIIKFIHIDVERLGIPWQVAGLLQAGKFKEAWKYLSYHDLPGDLRRDLFEAAHTDQYLGADQVEIKECKIEPRPTDLNGC